MNNINDGRIKLKHRGIEYSGIHAEELLGPGGKKWFKNGFGVDYAFGEKLSIEYEKLPEYERLLKLLEYKRLMDLVA